MDGYVLSKDIVVAEVTNNNVRVIREDLCPLLLNRTKDLETWLLNRVIDKHRPSSRVLRKILRLTSSNDMTVVLKFNAVSLTDTYWFKEKNSKLTWREATTVIDYFSPIVEDKEIDYEKLPDDLRTFELTNTGSYEKCWKHTKHGWILLKKQRNEEVISEVLAYELGRLLGFNVATYMKISDTVIASHNFIENWNYNFEDAYSIVEDEEDIEYNFKKLSELSSSLVEDYFKMLVFDALFMNVDRHTHNYGILRDVNTGVVVSLAPLYDHNMCLYGSRMTVKNNSPKMFFDAVRSGKKYNKNYRLPDIEKSELTYISNDVKVIDFVYNNYLILKVVLEEY